MGNGHPGVATPSLREAGTVTAPPSAPTPHGTCESAMNCALSADTSAANASLERAIELNPSFADAYALLGGIHTYTGEPAKSIAPLRTALRFKPDGGYLVYLLLGRAYFFQGDLEQALVNLREAVARNPSDVEVRLYLAASLQASGQSAAAAWELEEVRMLDRNFSLDAWLENYPLASPELRMALRKPLER